MKTSLGRGREIIWEWVNDYHNRRLHAGINHLRPRDYYLGEPEKLLGERKRKLVQARERRRKLNRERYWKTEGNYTNLNRAKTLIYA